MDHGSQMSVSLLMTRMFQFRSCQIPGPAPTEHNSSVQDRAKPGPAQDEHSSASAAITRKRLREKTAVPQSQGTKRKIGFPDGQVSPPTSAIANQVSGKRKEVMIRISLNPLRYLHAEHKTVLGSWVAKQIRAEQTLASCLNLMLASWSECVI